MIDLAERDVEKKQNGCKSPNRCEVGSKRGQETAQEVKLDKQVGEEIVRHRDRVHVPLADAFQEKPQGTHQTYRCQPPEVGHGPIGPRSETSSERKKDRRENAEVHSHAAGIGERVPPGGVLFPGQHGKSQRIGYTPSGVSAGRAQVHGETALENDCGSSRYENGKPAHRYPKRLGRELIEKMHACSP